MKLTFNIAITLLSFSYITSCNGQTEKLRTTVPEDFDKSPPIYYGMPDTISSKDVSPGWVQNGQKILLTGIVYQQDGRTPASNILMYYYQTNTEGRYLHKEEEKRSIPKNTLGQTHGYIRGWVKTDKQGKYSIYTIRPGTYSSRDEPAHIHVTIKESDLEDHYYIDDFVFDDDILLTTTKRKAMENRGGTGVLRLVSKDDLLLVGERNIILGLNIPNYPKENLGKINSGKNIGEDIISFTPEHAWGVDKGTNTCPICKYGWYHGILYFVGNHPNWGEINQWLNYLDTESIRREKYLKVYFVYGNEFEYSQEKRMKELSKIGRELQLKQVALTFVPSFSDTSSEIHLNKINPNVENTFLIYKRSSVINKFVNLKPTQNNFNNIANILDQSVNEYFYMPRLGKE